VIRWVTHQSKEVISVKEGEIEILFVDVHNQYSTHYVNTYVGELVGHLLSIFPVAICLNTWKQDLLPYQILGGKSRNIEKYFSG
jgi:hypothetical protein